MPMQRRPFSLAAFKSGPVRISQQASTQGFFVADRPLYLSLGGDPYSDPCLEMTIDDRFLAGREWIEEFKAYREWLVPADVLNAHAVVRAVPVEQLLDLEWG
jgi:hypothetical protein